MNISSLGFSQLSSLQFNKLGNQGGPGGADDVQGGPPPGPPPGGRLDGAILGALADIGISGSSSSSDGTTTDATGSSSTTTDATGGQNVADAFRSFMHTLMSTLHAQGASNQQASAAVNAGNAADAANADTGGADAVGAAQGHHHHHGGGPGRLEADLQSLVQKLTASSSTSSSSDSSSGSTSDSDTSQLASSFQNLLSALGASSGSSDSNATLSKFLQALETRLQGAPSTGNVVNTTA